KDLVLLQTTISHQRWSLIPYTMARISLLTIWENPLIILIALVIVVPMMEVILRGKFPNHSFISLNSQFSSTLTPIHVRKAELMFFFTCYLSSVLLKYYFPYIRFNKNNTAQLVKWFSNFR